MDKRPQFLVDPPRSGQDNMAIDSAWLHFAERRQQAFTLIRFYRWTEPTVSIGRHQNPASALDADYCCGQAIPMVRRPTGGRAVFHDQEVTYAVISNDPAFFPVPGILGTYRVIAEGLRLGLRRLGIEATLSSGVRSGTRPTPRRHQGDAVQPCFSSPSRFELLFAGRKMVGSAQCRLKRSFLQHGSLPLEIDYERMGRALGCAPDRLAGQMISLSEAAGTRLRFDPVCSCLVQGFQEHFRGGG